MTAGVDHQPLHSSKTRRVIWFAGLLFSLAAFSALASNYDEGANGDISGDRLAPTTITLEIGSNFVAGFFGMSPAPSAADLDYFTVIIPAETKLIHLTLRHLDPGGANSFLGVESGPVMTLPPTSHDPSPLLGWNHIYRNQEGTDLLPALNLTAGLVAGSYTFWINETDASANYSYGFDFEVQPVPEPSGSWLLAVAAAVPLAFYRRR